VSICFGLLLNAHSCVVIPTSQQDDVAPPEAEPSQQEVDAADASAQDDSARAEHEKPMADSEVEQQCAPTAKDVNVPSSTTKADAVAAPTCTAAEDDPAPATDHEEPKADSGEGQHDVPTTDEQHAKAAGGDSEPVAEPAEEAPEGADNDDHDTPTAEPKQQVGGGLRWLHSHHISLSVGIVGNAWICLCGVR
jgi:hypothetical protein